MRGFRLTLIITMFLVASSALAQTTASLTGTATLGGNPLPGVSIAISSPSMKGTRTTVTDENGNYNIGAIPPGAYTVKFSMEGMQPVTRTVRVGNNPTARCDASMQVSAVKKKK